MKRVLLFFVFLSLVSTPTALAHPGNTASDGCHYCRTNCDSWGVAWNERHCHGGSTYTAPPVVQYTSIPTYTPRPTATPIPPTNTPTSVPPTRTPTPIPTKSPTPTKISTPTFTLTPTEVVEEKVEAVQEEQSEKGIIDTILNAISSLLTSIF